MWYFGSNVNPNPRSISDCSVLAPCSACTLWYKDCWCISVLDACCEARWDFWNSSWFGATNSWGTQYCQSIRHKTDRCLDTYRVVIALQKRGPTIHTPLLTLLLAWWKSWTESCSLWVYYRKFNANTVPLITAVLFCRTGNSNSESILLVEDKSNCRRSPWALEKVREAGTAVWEALCEVEDKIPPEGCQGQTSPDGPKKSLLLSSTGFKEAKHILSVISPSC